MVDIENITMTFSSEAELDKALAIVDEEWAFAGEIEAGCLNGHRWFLQLNESITLDEMNNFIKRWKEQN